MSGVPVPNTQAMFYEQYEAVRRDEVVGILLALFLGTFGVHHFYLRRTGLGVLYCCFFWTGITAVLGFIECFFMPSRVREFNAIQAAGIAAALGMSVPAGWGWPVNVNIHVPPAPAGSPQAAPVALPLAGPQVTCGRCQRTNVAGSRFCSACGALL
jgi:TM2 domain-containing membrane protein YozV